MAAFCQRPTRDLEVLEKLHLGKSFEVGGTFDLPSFLPSFLRSTFDELVLFELVKYVYSLYLTISHNPPFYIKGLLLLHRGNSSTFISRVVEKFQKLVFHAVERFVF